MQFIAFKSSKIKLFERNNTWFDRHLENAHYQGFPVVEGF
jgi:hypothetical protein